MPECGNFALNRQWGDAVFPPTSLWDRSVESPADYRAGSETLARKRNEAGTDAQRLLAWLAEPPKDWVPGVPKPLDRSRSMGVQHPVSRRPPASAMSG